MFAVLRGKYWIITSSICNGKRHDWKRRGGVGGRAHGGKPNKEMRKPVRTVLSCLHITKLGHCYSFPSSKTPGLGEAESIKIYLPLH